MDWHCVWMLKMTVMSIKMKKGNDSGSDSSGGNTEAEEIMADLGLSE